MKKIYPSAAAALEGVLRNDMLIASGGFGLCGIPERLIDAIANLSDCAVAMRCRACVANCAIIRAAGIPLPHASAMATATRDSDSESQKK